jgi:hypothetical protein
MRKEKNQTFQLELQLRTRGQKENIYLGDSAQHQLIIRTDEYGYLRVYLFTNKPNQSVDEICSDASWRKVGFYERTKNYQALAVSIETTEIAASWANVATILVTIRYCADLSSQESVK